MGDLFKDGIVALIPKLRAYATVLTGSTAEADDLVQDALMRAWRFRDNFQPGTNLKAWLFKILRNEFLNQLNTKKPWVQDVDGRMAAQLICAPDQEWRLRYGELVEGLRMLSEDTRDALLLVAGSGLTYEEAADLCGCAVGTIKSRVSRARQRLSEIVDLELPAPMTMTRAVARSNYS